MKRFHNPLTLFMLILIAVGIITVTIVFLAVDSLSLNIAYWSIIVMLLILLPVTVIGERKFIERDRKLSEEFGEDINTASEVSSIMKESPKSTILIIMGVFIFIGGLTALIMYNAVLGWILFGTIIFGVLFIALYNTRKRNSIEEYINDPLYRRSRPVMQEIHNRVLSLNPAIVSGIGAIEPFGNLPTYGYLAGKSKSNIVTVLSMGVLINGSIRIISHNADVFNAFSDRLKNYKPSLQTEFSMPRKEPFDYELLTDIVKFTIEQIDSFYSQNEA